jgi:hypothetical protein
MRALWGVREHRGERALWEHESDVECESRVNESSVSV